MREWLVAGAVIEQDDGLLLVRNTRRDGSVDWTPPGGVIDGGESVLDGLGREVTEETGLVVTRWGGPLWRVEAEAPDLGWRLRVEVHQGIDIDGTLAVDDPDGIVTDACFVGAAACSGHLRPGPRWVGEPLLDWLEQRWDEVQVYEYLVEGTSRETLRVQRR